MAKRELLRKSIKERVGTRAPIRASNVAIGALNSFRGLSAFIALASKQSREAEKKLKRGTKAVGAKKAKIAPRGSTGSIPTLGNYSSWIIAIKYNFDSLVFSAELNKGKWYDWPGVSHQVWFEYLNPVESAQTPHQYNKPKEGGGLGTIMWHSSGAALFRSSPTKGFDAKQVGKLVKHSNKQGRKVKRQKIKRARKLKRRGIIKRVKG